MQIETSQKFGFVIIVSDGNIGLLRSTINSIRSQYPDAPYVCVTEKNTSAEDLDAMRYLCPTYIGSGTITSLLNAGYSFGPAEWNIAVMAGSYVSAGVVRKLFVPVKTNKDIVFAIVPDYDRQGKPLNLNSGFVDASLNGLMVHRDTFKKVGSFSDNPLEVSKTFWAMSALDHGCVFKGVLGVKIL